MRILPLPNALALMTALLAAPMQRAWGADASRPSDIYSLSGRDYALVPVSLAIGIAGQLAYRGMTPADTGALDKQKDLWAMDRWAAGYHSHLADLSSDLAIYPLVCLPGLVSAWELAQGRQSWGGAIADAVVFTEAMSLSSGLDLWVRSLQVHPRPLVYDRKVPASERLSPEASGSFYSGHSNAAFLSAVYFAYSWTLRNPGSDKQGWVWAGSLGAASIVAGLRIGAGKHYLSDVLVGAAAGSFFGFAFPWLHRHGGEGGGMPAVGVGMAGPRPYPMLAWTF